MSNPPPQQGYPPPQQGYPPPQQGYPPQNTPYNPPPQGMAYQAAPPQYSQPQQQVHYRPGQPQGYQQGQPQVGYGQQPVFQQQVVTAQPVQFEQVPVQCQCPHCHASISSKVEREIGSTTWLYCILLSFVCCCCCPFFMDCAKDASHSCPSCKKHLGTFKQPLVQSGGGGGGGRGYDHGFGGRGDDGTGGGAADQSGE